MPFARQRRGAPEFGFQPHELGDQHDPRCAFGGEEVPARFLRGDALDQLAQERQ